MRTWPPAASGAWYSADSAQQTFSGSHDGTVAASTPPGRSTRRTSAMAPVSSGMCSKTSEQMTRSKVSSGNGRRRASPLSATPSPSLGASPASRMAQNSLRTSPSSEKS